MNCRRMLARLTVLVVLVLAFTQSGLPSRPQVDSTADSPPCGFGGTTCPVTGAFDPLSLEGEIEEGKWAVTGPSAAAPGALVYDPDFVLVEQAARQMLKCGLDVRLALSPYKDNVEFQTYVKEFDLRAGWGEAAPDLYDTACFGTTENLGDVIDAADQDLRQARDLYAFLAVHAPEYRFRADSRYVTDTPTGYDAPLCGVTDKEDPDPPDPAHSGQVLDPIIDWCNFPARLRQSVREAANLRMLFGQQFMVDAMGLHFSGTEFYGGEDAVRRELAQLRAAKHQFELAERGLAEALGRAVGSGCYVSDFYKQSEWSLLSRAMENQETAQHHIAVRLSYLDIGSPEEVPEVHAVAQEAFRQASTEGYIRLIGMASLGAAQPLGEGCDVGERPDGLLAAEMAANLLETRRQARELADGRNVFGFEVSFTPARRFKNEAFQSCEATAPGERGLWDEAWCAADLAWTLQVAEVDNTRAFDESQEALLEEIEEIRAGIDARIVAVSGCTNPKNNDEAWFVCVDEQKVNLETCSEYVTDPVEYEKDEYGHPIPTQPIKSEFDKCITGEGGYPAIKNGEAKQALLDLRAVYVGYEGLKTRADNINDRVDESDERNAVARDQLFQAGTMETVANMAEVGYEFVNCVDYGDVGLADAKSTPACLAATFGWAVLEGLAGNASTEAKVQIEDAEHNQEVQNLVIDMNELVIDAYAAQQQFFAKKTAFLALLEGMRSDLSEAQRQRAYFEHCPANDPSYRMVRDSSRMVLAKQMEYAARMAYLAARRAEYEYAARLSASNFRISDIYRARTADDIKRYLQQMRSRIDNLPGGVTNSRDLTISLARHFADPDTSFGDWVCANTSTPSGGKPVFRYSLLTSLLEDGLISDIILENYDSYWLHKLSGIGDPMPSNNGVSLNLLTTQDGLSYREARLTQGGTVHLRSQAGCIFDYKLIAPAFLLGLEWASNQDPEVATASFKANVNEAHAYTEAAFRAPEFNGRAVSSTAWEVVVYLGAPQAGLPDMDCHQLTDIELIFSTTYASRTPGEPELSECTRIDW